MLHGSIEDALLRFSHLKRMGSKKNFGLQHSWPRYRALYTFAGGARSLLLPVWGPSLGPHLVSHQITLYWLGPCAIRCGQ